MENISELAVRADQERGEELKKWGEKREEAEQLLKASRYLKKPGRTFLGRVISMVRWPILFFDGAFAEAHLGYTCPKCNTKLDVRIVPRLGWAVEGYYTILTCPCDYQYAYEVYWLAY